MNAFTRRDFLYGLGLGLGTVAFDALLRDEALADAGPLAVKPPHRSPRAKACIMLFMEGGPSHIDTFDPKPKLDALHLKEFIREDTFASAMASGRRYYIKSPFQFRQCGQSGLWMNTLFERLGEQADDLCVYHGLQADSINHPTACFHMNTGNRFGGDPALGSWVTYGLGSANQNLPGFVVLPELHYPQGGAANWSNGFLPGHYQGTALRGQGPPILDMRPPAHVTREVQRRNLDLLARLNAEHQTQHPQHAALAARMEAYELAFRMQMEVPGVLELTRETAATQSMYGLDNPATADIGRKCLLARRLVEQGVRFVQIYVGGWDSHDYIAKAHGRRIRAIDKPLAALLRDLKQRSLLEDTLVVWGGEFGRTPDNGLRAQAKAAGRDHNRDAMALVMAGGGVKAGTAVGATDELGATAIERVRPIRDLHVTLLHLFGLDDNKLTFFHGGRFKQLSQTGGEVIEDLLA